MKEQSGGLCGKPDHPVTDPYARVVRAQSWTGDSERCRAAWIPPEAQFAVKPL
jgi:hypothetical protein